MALDEFLVKNDPCRGELDRFIYLSIHLSEISERLREQRDA